MNCNFKDVEADIEKWLEKHGTHDLLPGGQACIRGYDNAKKSVIAAYFDQQAYEQLVSFALKGYRDEKFIEELTEALLKVKDAHRLLRLWGALVAESKLTYWQSFAVNRFFDAIGDSGEKITKEEVAIRHAEIVLPHLKTDALKVMRRFELILKELGGDKVDLTRISQDISLLESGQKRKIVDSPLKRTIDEAVFWELINELQVCFSTDEKSAHLVTLLERYSANNIKRFQKILLDKMDLANNFDIWALAFLAQDGCSDDAFESFRGWLILQGKSFFESAVKDPNAVAYSVPPGIETRAEHLLACAAVAYENRTGEPLLIRAPKCKTKGERWSEGALKRLYPTLWQRYVRKE